MDMGIDAGTANQRINTNVYDDFDELDRGSLQSPEAPDTTPSYLRAPKPKEGGNLERLRSLETLQQNQRFSPKDDEDELAAALQALRGIA